MADQRKGGKKRKRRAKKKQAKADAAQVELLPAAETGTSPETETAGETDSEVESPRAEAQPDATAGPMSSPHEVPESEADPELGPTASAEPEPAPESDPDPDDDPETASAVQPPPPPHEPDAAPAPPSRRLAEARGLVEAGNVGEAIEAYSALLVDEPDNFKAHNNLGVLFDELGRKEEAVEHFRSALALQAESVELHTNLAGALTALARLDEAGEVLEQALRLAPSDPDARLAAGVLSFRRGLYPQAEVELRAVCERDARNGLAFYYRGEALNRAGRYAEAVTVMLEAADLLPEDPRPHYTLGHLYDREGRREEAAEMYRKARDFQARAEKAKP